jgi:hypothetical protein
MKAATTAAVAALLASAATTALAAPSCTVEALNGLHVHDVSVTSAKPVAAATGTPAYCDVQGTVTTHGEGAPDGLAKFAMQLPDTWQQRFFFMGVGGNAGGERYRPRQGSGNRLRSHCHRYRPYR